MLKKTAAVLLLALGLAYPGLAPGGQVTLAWDPNAEPDLSGYRLHYGLAPGESRTTIDVGNVTSYTVGGLADGQTHYFTATAYDRSGNESGHSNEVSYTVPVPVPGAVYATDFENASEADRWNSQVSLVRGDALLERDCGQAFTGSCSLRVSGGSYQAVRSTVNGLTVGQTVVFSGAVKVIGSTLPVYIRLNGVNKTDWTQVGFNPNGGWQYFAVPKTITSLDAAGLDVNVMVLDPAATVYLDAVAVGADLYASGFSTVAGWNNAVYQVGGDAALSRVSAGAQAGADALRVAGGTRQAARFTIYGLSAKSTVTFTGWVKTASAEPVAIRMNGLNRSDWTQSSVASDGAWNQFSLSKTLTDLDSTGLDINVVLPDASSELFLDEVRVFLSPTVTHEITASAGPHGRIVPAGVTAVVEGTDQLYRIYPDPCYHVLTAQSSDGAVGNFTSHLFSNVTGAGDISATFAVDTFSIEASVIGTGGAISSPGVSTVACGESRTYDFLPDSGKQGKRLLVGGIPQAYASSYTFAGVDADQTIAVEFEDLPPAPPLYATGFESASDADGWDNQVSSVGGNAQLAWVSGQAFEGSGALRVSGGTFQAVRSTVHGLTAGQTVVFSGAVKVVGSTNPVYVRLNGVNKNDWTQVGFNPTGAWQYFAVPKTITSLDTAGLDVNVMVMSAAATVYLDSLAVSEELYVNDFSTIAGWNNAVYQVGGSAALSRVSTDPAAGADALLIAGGAQQAGRFTIHGLSADTTVTFTGWVKAASAEPVTVRMHGLNRTDWTQSSVASDGAWRQFSLSKTLTALDAGGLDIDVILPDPAAELLVDEVRVRQTAAP